MPSKTRLLDPLTLAFVAGAVAGTALLVEPQPAEACGGCFTPPMVVTAVDSHRMVVSLHTSETILWDQIRYTGAPQDFVWVLPVPATVADVDVADPTWFEELDVQTSVTIVGPPPPQPQNCAPPPGLPGAGDNEGGFQDAGTGPVTVYEEETVGPYEMKLVGSTDPMALQTWLVDHGYNVPVSTVPTIAHYVQAGSNFIVLRLAPGQDVAAMQPVRVRYPGYMSTFPLEMIKVGAAGVLDLTLWVVADQRQETKGDYVTSEITADELTWDFAKNASDYRAVFDAKVDAAGGKGWIVQSSLPMNALFFSEPDEPALARANRTYAYVTRLSTRMLVDHMDADLELGPSADTSDVPTFLQLSQAINVPPAPQCPDWDGDGAPDTNGGASADGTDSSLDVFACRIAVGRDAAAPLGLACAGALVLLALRRRRR